MTELILLSGLPGVGKSTLARAFAARTGAVHLEVDVAEAAVEASVLAPPSAEDAGYRVLAAQSAAHVAQSHVVIADMVLADPLGRALWDFDKVSLIVEVINTNKDLHQARVEARHAATPRTPDWSQVQARAWTPLDRDVLTLDAAVKTTEAMVSEIPMALT